MMERITTAKTETTMLESCQFFAARCCDQGGGEYQLHALSADTTGFMVAGIGGDKAVGES